MTKIDYNVKPLFAEPIFRAGIGYAISEKQVEFIKNLNMIPNQTNLISENLSIFEEPELKSIKDAVHQALNIYAQEVMGMSAELYVTQSWSLINYEDVGMHGHSHSNSLVSGSLYYTDLPEPNANMIFDRHTSYQQLEIRPEEGKQNLFNTRINAIQPQKNEILLFSSRLQHFVEKNKSKEPRYSIAFNSFIKGTIGDLRDVSQLVL